jgi:hypothetical protein
MRVEQTNEHYEGRLWIEEFYHAVPHEHGFENFISPRVDRLTGPPRRKKTTEIVIHETVTISTPITIGVLKKRRLGVHFIIGPDAEITQHADPSLDQLAHCGRVHNPHSVGIEIVNPYYPEYNTEGPWERVIGARWAHKKKYVLPTAEQAEANWLLVDTLLSIKTDSFNVPRKWIGHNPEKQRFAMSRITRARLPLPGVMAHNAFGHADGSWPLLYCFLRDMDKEPAEAYRIAVDLAETNRWWVDLREAEEA